MARYENTGAFVRMLPELRKACPDTFAVIYDRRLLLVDESRAGAEQCARDVLEGEAGKAWIGFVAREAEAARDAEPAHASGAASTGTAARAGTD